MNDLNHEAVRDLLAGAALEVLEPGERALVLEHVADCADCGDVLIEYREVLGHELEADRSDRLRDRLIARAVAEQRAAAGPIRERASRNRARAVLASRWAGWVVAAGLMSILLFHHGIHRPLGAGWIAAGVASVATVALGIYAAVQRRRVAALRAELESRRQENH